MEDTRSAVRRGLLSAMKRNAAVAVFCAVLLAVLAGGFASSRTTSFTARASVLVNPLQGNPYSPTGRGDELINLGTEAQLVVSDPVGRDAAERLSQPLSSAEQLLAAVSVTVPPNTQILQIKFASDTPEHARLGAEAFAASYLAYRADRAANVLTGRTEQLDDQIAAIEERLAAASEEQSAQATDPARRNLLGEQVAAYIAQLSEIEGRRSELLVTDVDSGQVISPPVAGAPGGLSVPLLGAAGAIGGLFLGVLIGFWRERRNDRVYNVYDLKARRVPLLTDVISEQDPESPDDATAEQFRRLRTALLAAPKDHAVVLVTNTSRGGVTGATASGLAIALARADFSVVLVEAMSGRLDSSVEAQGQVGLSDVLLDKQSANQFVLRTSQPRLCILPAGRNTTVAAERYAGGRMRGVVDELKEAHDFVIIDAPPVTQADGEALIKIVDQVLLVVTLRLATWRDLHQSFKNVERFDGSLMGVVPLRPTGRRIRQLRGHDESRLIISRPDPAPVDQSVGATPLAR